MPNIQTVKKKVNVKGTIQNVQIFGVRRILENNKTTVKR